MDIKKNNTTHTNTQQQTQPQNQYWKETVATKPVHDCWPAALYPQVTRISKFWLAGRSNLHDNNYKKWFPFMSSVCTALLSHWLTPHSQPAPRISIRIEITVKIHMLQLARLVDLLHPGHQTDLFCQGKQLLTLKVDKHLNLFLSCYGIGHPKGTYQSPTVNVNKFHCCRCRDHTCKNLKVSTSAVEENRSVRTILRSELPGSPRNPLISKRTGSAGARHCYSTLRTATRPGSCISAAQLQVQEQNWRMLHLTEATHPYSPTGAISQVFASKIYKFTYISLYLVRFLPLPWDQPKQ